jgi:hypothetical protein
MTPICLTRQTNSRLQKKRTADPLGRELVAHPFGLFVGFHVIARRAQAFLMHCLLGWLLSKHGLRRN